MLTFAVPFIPCSGFAEAVADRREAIHSIYAPLHQLRDAQVTAQYLAQKHH